MNPSAHMKIPNATHRARGAGLIEVLVAVLIFSLGLIGMLGLQSRALQRAESAYARSQATMLSYYMLDALRIDRTRAIAGDYNLTKTCQIVADSGTLITHQQHHWLTAIKTTMGDAGTCGEIICNSNTCTVRIYWDDDRATPTAAEASIEVRTQL